MYKEFVNDTTRALVKVDLGNLHPTEAVSTFIDHQIQVAASRIIDNRKIPLVADNIDDLQLVAMYAAYLYRKRDSGATMPDMLRSELNDRVVKKGTVSK